MQTMMNDFMEKYKPSTSSTPTPAVPPLVGGLSTDAEARTSDSFGDNSDKDNDDEEEKE